MRHAAIVDRQIQQEQADRAAVGEAAGALAGGNDPYNPNGVYGPGGFGPGPGSVAYDVATGRAKETAPPDQQDAAAIDRVRNIASRLPPQYAIPFVKAANETHQKLVDKRERDALTDKISNAMTDGSLFTVQPNGTKVEDKGSTDAAKQLLDALGKGEDVGAIKARFANLQHAQAMAEQRYRRRVGIGQWIDQQAQSIGQNETQGVPQDPARVLAQHQQAADLHKLATWWTQFQDDIEGHPLGMQKLTEAVLNAVQGKTYVNGKLVRYEDAEKQRELDQAKAERDQAVKQSQILLNEARARAVENPALHRTAGATPSTVDKSPSPEALYQQAQKSAIERFGAKWDEMTPEQQDAETLKQMGRIKYAARGFAAQDEGVQGGAPTPEAQSAAGALDTTRLASPQLREADLRAHPEKYQWLGGDVEKTRAWIKEGKRQ